MFDLGGNSVHLPEYPTNFYPNSSTHLGDSEQRTHRQNRITDHETLYCLKLFLFGKKKIFCINLSSDIGENSTACNVQISLRYT